MEPEPAFVMGMMFGALLLWFAQSLFRSHRLRKESAAKLIAREHPDEQRRLREIDELHKRLAVLERLATDPAERTAAEIERLR
ncbi:hypothetical protein RCO27_05350 [Sphingosinicella sp. LHD-64]|uniref:hypothetical protein n=1 Tax=Sphingosinicella sp. LHD-64 TaxID=3072139 RepID=UPI00280D3F95|nr:hypothetical protein [Sphingosinicella sp. LHD-64]MDQ8755648.1 hypothetical protein [Sphingosinicella sp. LHD-64]